jgi:hypothetical protein
MWLVFTGITIWLAAVFLGEPRSRLWWWCVAAFAIIAGSLVFFIAKTPWANPPLEVAAMGVLGLFLAIMMVSCTYLLFNKK